ncbi:MerR family transcriptional regulator [Nocardia salmonicida]|uniref:MerR family transcriptional regulator n=1 Tax=Nocardia salmonicida TaxID=53431 RepID=UPI00340C35B4
MCDLFKAAVRRKILHRVAAIGQRVGLGDHFGDSDAGGRATNFPTSPTITDVDVTDKDVLLALMELTIDELARTVDMSARNIREWQTLRLLAPPERKGRVGVYTDAHVARIRRIQQLRGEGFPLDLIRRTLDSPDRPAAQVDRIATQALTPFSDTDQPTSATSVELNERFGDGAELLLHGAGLILRGSGEQITVPDPALLELLERLTDVGIPLKDAVGIVEDAGRRLRELADLFISGFAQHVWEPFVAQGMPPTGWQPLADAMTDARTLADDLQSRLFLRAIDDVAATFLVKQAHHAQATLDAEPTEAITE